MKDENWMSLREVGCWRRWKRTSIERDAQPDDALMQRRNFPELLRQMLSQHMPRVTLAAGHHTVRAKVSVSSRKVFVRHLVALVPFFSQFRCK